MNQVEQCPKCGAFIEGDPVYDTSRSVARSGMRWATKKMLIYLATPILGTFVFPVVGTVFGFIIAWVTVAYIQKTSENITDYADQNMYSSLPFVFNCPKCGHSWERVYMKGVDFATDSVLRWQKSQQIESIKSSSNSALKIAIIAGLIGVPCAIYCFTPFSDQPDYLLWWLLFIVGMPALGIALERGIKSYTKRREADELDNMTVFEFRRSSYRVGSPFVGVVQNPNEDVKPKISERKECSRSEEQEFEVEERKNNVELPSEQKPDNIAVEKKEMIKCSVCGEEVEKGTHICPYCNEPLIEIHYVPCPICGEMIPSNSEFCPECDEYVELNKNE